MSRNRIGAPSLAGKVAIVTGGSRGIGRAVAMALVGAGTAVVIGARGEDELIETASALEAAGGRAAAVVGDVVEPETGPRLVAAALDAFGSCDILINAAAIGGPIGEVETLDVELLEHTLRVNFTGTFLTCRAALPAMKKRRWGRIINVASGLAVRAQPGRAAYAASKAAVLQFSRVLAEEVRDDGILVNAVHPGIVRTAMVEEIMSYKGGGIRGQAAARLRALDQEGALLEPQESARLFLWVAGACTRTGGFIRIDDPQIRRRIAAA